MYVLDTDHLSLNLRGHPKIRERLAIVPADEIAITIITAEEQLRGRLAQVGKAASGLRINFSSYRQVTPTEFSKPVFTPPTVGCSRAVLCYSYRSAINGSTFVARRAGM